MAHISFEESIKILSENLPKSKGSERVFLDSALNRVLAKDIIAKFNNPYKETASMDGYAIKYSDHDKELRIIGKNPAGSFRFNKLKSGEAIKTYTGSFMPDGADTLVPIENVEVKGNKLKILKKVEKGFAVREIGEDFKKGDVLIKKGKVIKSAEIGVLASLGIPVVDVVKKPIVSIISTGEEIVDLDSEYEIGQIRSSNNYTLTALAKSLGFIGINLGIAGDNKKEIKEKILDGLKNSDVVVTTGGVSVGDFDFVKEITGEFDLLFHGVNIKPGQWIMVAKAGEKYIVSLPGFPYSSFVTFLLYVVPILESLENRKIVKKIKAKLLHNFIKTNPKYQFVAVNITFDGSFYVDTIGKKQGSSGILTNLINNKALMCLKEGTYELKKGEEVEVLVYDDLFR
ncbi:molybdopterin molybdotransferase MoeA [Caminibacter mediatlanticus]|uniref:Molybdopterin molybdenumtransferase n=1 Tax=Caminibacter mediatlanticus TB-2 TaxID=391592 RepID=A0AAI9AH22_9BACT|nr:molybdopterin molybdotransferase MoeA [Caminibacter mediatlanticus]EDM23369.1 Molybdopterin binding domain [Caminibacter mediatlanticus TB-2]